jgi:hypothetical protein
VIREPIITAVEGSEYVYTATIPAGCKGHRYRLLKLVLDVPTYQQKLCMVALTGPDSGRWFVVSPWNFAQRYEPAEVDAPQTPDPVAPEKVAGVRPESRGSGV